MIIQVYPKPQTQTLNTPLHTSCQHAPWWSSVRLSLQSAMPNCLLPSWLTSAQLCQECPAVGHQKACMRRNAQPPPQLTCLSCAVALGLGLLAAHTLAGTSPASHCMPACLVMSASQQQSGHHTCTAGAARLWLSHLHWREHACAPAVGHLQQVCQLASTFNSPLGPCCLLSSRPHRRQPRCPTSLCTTLATRSTQHPGLEQAPQPWRPCGSSGTALSCRGCGSSCWPCRTRASCSPASPGLPASSRLSAGVWLPCFNLVLGGFL